jgi:transmembrane sensor
MEIDKTENIDRLIANCLAEKASDEDFELLKNWIKASKSNFNYFHQIQNIWDSSNMDEKISEDKILAAFKKVELRIYPKKSKNQFIQYLQKIAAILVIPFAIGGYLLGTTNQNIDAQLTNNDVYTEAKAAYGTRTSLQLADGSKVWLNSGSSLKYPLKFSKNERKVLLSGEAYFEVQSDKSSPFIVHTKNMDVKATGTKFNVQAFSSSSSTEVALKEGKVEIFKTETNKKPTLIRQMKPNQFLLYDSISEQTSIKDEDVYRYIAWKDGRLVFRSESLAEVAEKLSILYHVDIELKGEKLKEQRYWGTFQEESLANILKFLKISSPINYKEITGKRDKDGTFPKKKFIIYQSGK